MPSAEAELRGRLARAGLEGGADALVHLAAPSIRLCPEDGPREAVSAYPAPAVVPGLEGGVWAIAGSGYHNLVARRDGTVVAWGANESGQLGDGTRTDRRAPVPVAGLDGVTVVSAGQGHSLALTSSGSVLAWGNNTYGQLGDGTREDRRTPTPVNDLGGGAAGIAAGEKLSLALRADGSVVGWGLSAGDQLGIDAIPDGPVPLPGLSRGVVAIATGRHHRLALRSNGTVLAWGLNAFGQLGDGTAMNRLRPEQVTGLARITAISAGDYHSLALTADGLVLAWGMNSFGQLGDGTTAPGATPAQVAGLGGRVRAIAAGDGSSFALREDGSVAGWGWNYEGQLGDGGAEDTTAPVVMRLLGRCEAISRHLALRADGLVLAWGRNAEPPQPGFDAHVPVGTTKLGGCPDLPTGSAWPSRGERPLSFVAQVKLAELEPLLWEDVLPPAGLLSFFFEGTGESVCHVAFTEPGAVLARLDPPEELPNYQRYRGVALNARTELTLPSSAPSWLSAEQREKYQTVAADSDDGPRHRTLGHPDLVQNDPRDSGEQPTLLLQVDSDDAAGMMWGDLGRLYYWLRPDDLAARRFGRTVVDDQSH